MARSRMEVKGLDEVNQDELKAHYIRTEALWSKLVEQGVRSRSQGHVEAFLFAKDEQVAVSLAAGYVKQGWRRTIELVENGSEVRIKLVSQLVRLTRVALLDLVDVMMVSAHHHGCVLDGFQVNVSAVRRRPWWRFW